MILFLPAETNTSSGDTEPDVQNASIVTFNCVICLWLILSNTLLLVTNILSSSFTKVNGMLVNSLALTDILTGIMYLIGTIAKLLDHYLVQTNWFCIFIALPALALVAASILQLAMISVIKLVHIKYPLTYAKYINDRSLVGSFVLVWLLCLCIHFTLKDIQGFENVIQCLQIYKMMLSTFTFAYSIMVVAILVMVALHIYLMKVSNEHIKRIAAVNLEEANALIKDAKARKAFTVITVAMVVCYLPNIVTFYVIIYGDLELTSFVINLWKATALLSIGGSTVNFFAHNYHNKELRSSMMKILFCGKLRNLNVIGASSSEDTRST